jgi:hypothetical protein
MTMDSALKNLIAAVGRIKQLSESGQYSTLAKARALPDEYAREVGGLRVDPWSSYGGRPSDNQQKLAERLKKRMVDEERTRGKSERDDLLAKYAAELESLRAILPALAAAASVELGTLSRALADEAKNGSAS